MGIVLGSNFTVNTNLPLDDRIIVADLTERDALVAGRRYEGLIVYVISEQKSYQLQAGITNVDWVEFGAGGDLSAILALLAALNLQADLLEKEILGVGDGVQTVFNIVGGPFNVNSVCVFVNGLMVSPTDYTLNPTDVTFLAAPALASDVEIIFLKSLFNDEFEVEELTGVVDGVNTVFNYVGATPKSIDGLLVFTNGTLLHKFNYEVDLLLSQITFAVAPALATTLTILAPSDAVALSDIKQDIFDADGVKTKFGPASCQALNAKSVVVFIDGVKVPDLDFEVVNKRYINFLVAPILGQQVSIVTYYTNTNEATNVEYRGSLSEIITSSSTIRLASTPILPDHIKIDFAKNALSAYGAFLRYGIDFTVVDDKLTFVPNALTNDIDFNSGLRIEYKV